MFVNTQHAAALDLLKSGKIQEAIDLYTQVLNDIGDHPDVLSDRGVAYLHANNKESCFRDLLKAKELEPERAYRYSSLAFARTHFKDYDNAIKDYERAIELDPEDSIAHNNLGLLLEQKGYENQAQQRFKRADELSKQEDHLIEMMEEMEEKEEVSEIKPDASNSQDKNESNSPENSKRKEEIKKIFTDRNQFKEFIRFIKNGFKLK